MGKKHILWVDDEIDLLRAHILFLEEKGYRVTPVNNGQDALDLYKENNYSIVFLDENMPGLSGMDTLNQMKDIEASTPIIMITKNEDEGIMEEAIGKKIADYLIKPVNPHQILHSLKNNLHKEDIVSEATLEAYRDGYGKISDQIDEANSFDEWVEIHKKLSKWDIELTASQNPLIELLNSQKQDANKSFARHIRVNYESWIQDKESRPLMSHELMSKQILPLLEKEESVLFVLIDNFRLDQWYCIRDILANYFSINEDTYCSILPTATQYARNAIFSGLTPKQIVDNYPQYWVEEGAEEGKNMKEEELLDTFFKRYRTKYTHSYHKLSSNYTVDRFIQKMGSLSKTNLNVLVLNFIDMLSHLRTESKMIKELASDEAAYRSLTKSWFTHSSTIDVFKKAAELGYKVVLTTDHGTIRVRKPLKVKGEKDLNTNLRYKQGHNLGYDRKRVYDITKPENIGLPSSHISTKYIFAEGDDFFAYPNNYNHYVSYYTDTFQHGGISLEEMIVPFVTLSPK